METLPVHDGKKFSPYRKILLAVFFVFLTLLFYLVNYRSPAWIEGLFRQGQTAWLNSITGVETVQPLEFYLGRAHETFFGPLSQVISGLGFAAFAILFLPEATLLQFGIAVFLYLILTKPEALLFPPYGDAIGGPFAEAIFLKDNGFNYIWLSKQAGYAMGGPLVYLFSIYPSYLAILMKLLPWPKVFLAVNHLVVFGMAATIATLLRSIFLKAGAKQGWPYRENSVLAILSTLLLLAIPAFQVQIEAINMEIPSAFFIMLSAYFLIEKRIHAAGLITIVAVFIKGTEILACWAFFLISLGLFFGLFEPKGKRSSVGYKILLWGGGLLVLSFLKVFSKFFIKDQHISHHMLEFAIGWASLYQLPLFYLYLVSLGIFSLAVWKNKMTAGEGRCDTSIDLYPVWVMFMYGGMWIVLFFNFYAVSPRYRVSLYPFLVFSVVYAVAFLIRKKYWKEWGIIVAVAVIFWSSYGAFYPSMEENDHVLLERSLEYRSDLEVNRHIARSIEARFSKFQIVAPFIIAQSLAIPELGYVSKKLKVMIYGYYCNYREIHLFPGIRFVKLAGTLYVGIKAVSPIPGLPYPVHNEDRVVEEIHYGNKKAWLFLGGISIDTVMRATNVIKLEELSKENAERK